MATCGCNGHTGNTGRKADKPQDWVQQVFGNSGSDIVYYSQPNVAPSDIIYDRDYEKLLNLINSERTRRALNPVTGSGTATDPFKPATPYAISAVPDVFTAGEVIDTSDYNSLINGLNQVYNSGKSPLSIGTLITASEINSLISSNYTAGQQCVCNCNYCTCNCNACLCNCNYACTCNCNYTYSDERLKTNIEYL